MAKILVVDDEQHVRKALLTLLSKQGYEVVEAGNGKDALKLLQQGHEDYSLVLLDLHMPEMSGMELLSIVHKQYSQIPVVIITAYSTAEKTMEAMSLGAFDYITKPFDISAIKRITAKALEMNRLTTEVKILRKTVAERYSLDSIIGNSSCMQAVYKMVGKVAATRVPVLIQGESGTGKELIAKSIHFNSARAGFPLVTINCGAIPSNLLESELFGHEKGAFTGAVSQKLGKIELADRGTLFLDEMGELPLELQVKLLRVLQEHEIERVGGVGARKIDVRVIAATNRNLLEMVKQGTFREDLYYRLNVVSIDLPPLRERREDITDLVQFFLERYTKEAGVDYIYMSPEAMEKLCHFHWPGNVRQLQNVVYRAVVMASGGMILPEDLPVVNRDSEEDVVSGNAFVLREKFEVGFVMRDVLRKSERSAMQWALEKTQGNKAHAAKMLDVSRKAFVYKCQEYGLDSNE
ncbi:MAG TPA: sigma-54 dependent transcriptional regulator [Bacillota bacterium]|nr:sigma-54 dependent transcriptional regulator [Bacillota bacterium]